MLQPLIHGNKQKVLVVSETRTSDEAAHKPPNIFSDITPSESEKEENKWSCVNARVLALYPGNPRRVYLHRNDPQRCGKGHQLTLPAGARPEALWTLLFNTANRVLNLNGWPGRCVFLDSTYFKWMSEEGLSEVLGRGALITARHLPFMTDGIELVVSDGKGDGLGCINKYYARGCVGQRRNKHRVLYLQDQDHWSVQYWRIFVRYYRFKQVLLSNLKKGKFDNAMLSRFREFDAAAVASSVLEANHEEANLTHADLEHWSIA